jgi:hypothetical protein
VQVFLLGDSRLDDHLQNQRGNTVRSSTIYDHPSDAMMANARKWLELALLGPSYERDFQKQIAEARSAETLSFDDAMTLAHAALMVAATEAVQSLGPWYRESAATLFCRAYDAVALEREARAAAQAGALQ